MEGEKGEKVRFFADAMLGSLARWMRTLGLDVEYSRSIGDDELLRAAIEGGRVILTRDTLLVRRRHARGRAYLVSSDRVSEQLKEVMKRFDIGAREPVLVRCLRCNALLEHAGREDVLGSVPQYVFETRREFSRCPACGRIYWGGTHRELMAKDLRRMLS